MKFLQLSPQFRQFALLLGTLLALCCLAAPSQAQVNHYSALIQANQPQFAARLETPGQPDAAALLGRTPAATMEYRIISERISNRRFFKLLADAIAVNSDATLLAKNAGYISRSRSALPTELQPNDSLVFQFDGTSQVTLSLNGSQLASYPAPDFFRMLVATWVGEVPISSRFKRQILGQESASEEIQALYDSTQVSAQRRQEVAALVSAATAVVAAPKAAEVVAPAAKAAPKPEPKPQVAKAPEPKPVPKVAAPVAKTEPAPKTAPKPAPTPKAEPQAAKAAPAVAAPAAAVVAAVPAAAKTPVETAKVAPQPELTEEEEATRLLVRQEYLKGLNREINTHKHIPQRAFTRRAEGSVRLALALDKNGRLLKVEIVEPSKHNMFNEQALEAVGNAQPFSPPPSILEADPFEFETTLYYDLPL